MNPLNLNENYGRKIINEKFPEANIISVMKIKDSDMNYSEICHSLREIRGAIYEKDIVNKVLENSKLILKIGEGNEAKYRFVF
jgi:hypothetical protein